MNFNTTLENFVDNLKRKDRSPSTIIAYKKDIEQLNEYLIKHSSTIITAETNIVDEFVKDLIRDETYTLKTISRKINSIKTFYKYLFEEKLVKENIAIPIEHPDFETKVPRVLLPLEYKALRDTVRNNLRLFTMVELLLQTGIRIGELSRLKYSDIKEQSKTIVLTISPFASNPERKVELNEAAASAINIWKVGNKEKNSQYLFSTKTGKPVLVRNIRTSINRAFKKVGIKDATVNDLRNTFIVHQLSQGVNLEKIAEVVGHQRFSSTEKYLGLVKSLPKKKINKLQVL